MNELDVFHFEQNRQSFEDYAQPNGGLFWYARDLAEMLGYESFPSFKNAINKATRTCMTLEISVTDNFKQIERDIDGKQESDWKLSRFACYLVAMNGDIKKPQVAAAQAYFATVAAAFQKAVQTATNVERVLIRDDVSVREVSLNSLAKHSGVENYPFFQNAGYRGMYNMNLAALREYKGVDGTRPLLDFMGNEELAANLFRITQTEARIRNENVKGQRALEVTAHHVGKKVRETMRELSGTVPEALPIAQDIKQVRSSLKSTHKGFAKIDNRSK
jgi:DNA-damage-inducible protein D